MTSLLNSGSSLLEKMEVFNYLTTFQFTQLTQLKQWSLLHANQPVVPQAATPVPGFERLMLLPEMEDQDVSGSTKSGFELTAKESFLEDLDEVEALFNGQAGDSMFNLSPEKDIDLELDKLLDEVLSEPSPSAPSITPAATIDRATNQAFYGLLHNQTNRLIQQQSNVPFHSKSNNAFQRQSNMSIHITPNNPIHHEANIPSQSLSNCSRHSIPNDLIHGHPKGLVHSCINNPVYSLANSPSHVVPNGAVHSHTNSPMYSRASTPGHSSRNSPINSFASSPVHSPSSSLINSPPQSPSVSEVGSNHCSTDEGIGSQSDISDLEGCDDYLDLSRDSAVLSLPMPESADQQLLSVKEKPQLLPTKSGRRKRGPRPQVKYRGDGPMQLWQFLLELLIASEYINLIRWTQDEDYEFKILKPTIVAKMWGEKKNKPTMNYEKLSRGLRYYYGKSVIEKVHGKRYVYQFKCDIPKILGYDPMAPIKSEESIEDAVCGEPVMSPEEVEDLLVTSSVEDSLLALL